MNGSSTKLDAAELEHSVSRAIDFLYESQLPYGEFRTYASPDQEMGDQSRFDSSPFVTSLVLHCVSTVDTPRAQEMRARALGFLQEEMEGPGLWRYWSSRNRRHKLLPPDLDDTCCISFILKSNHVSVPPNRDIILANRNGDGIFYTWVVPRSTSPSPGAGGLDYEVNPEAVLTVVLSGAVDNVDCAVNANVLLYLGESEDTKKAVDYLVGMVLEGKENGCSDFYPDRLSFYYMLSRAYCHGVLSLESIALPVTDRVSRSQVDDGSFGNELLSALAMCTLLNFGRVTPAAGRAVEHLLKAQREDGSWPRRAMFLGPAPYYGSEELTTALCVEALARYRMPASAQKAAGHSALSPDSGHGSIASL